MDFALQQSEVSVSHCISDKLGSMIKSTRINKHLTQKQLAERLFISPRYLMSLENNKQIPSCELLFRIIRELGISADMIFYPESKNNDEVVKKLQILLNNCDKSDIAIIITILQSLVQIKK
jgi:transcriptional regulator with XRE-family HTH domain